MASRTLNDGMGHTYQWQYHWGAPSSTGITNYVTDPLGNDTVHVFTALDGAGGCAFYETTTQYYQGAKSSRLLRQVDTTYYPVLIFSTYSLPLHAGNVVAKDITTTIYPSGKVSKIHREYDTGPGHGQAHLRQCEERT